MYEDYNGAPAAGVVVVLVMSMVYIIVANDASVKAGAWFQWREKNLRRNCDGKSSSNHLSRRFCWSLFTYAR